MFEFRLQRVLEYRERLEGWAKDTYLDSRAARLETEAGIHELRMRRGDLLENTPTDLNSRTALEATLLHLDDGERSQNVVLKVLLNEEVTALNAWHLTKRDLETLVRLREAALEEYKLEENRREQAELDEWAVLRRKAA
jgi:flagellar export protein FliJ